MKAIVSDSAANMRAMRNKIKESNPNIMMIGCAAHCFNFLIGDILEIPKIADIFGRSNHIVAEFSRSPLLSQKLKHNSGLKVKTLKKCEN